MIIPTYLGGPWVVTPVRDVFYELPLFPRLLTWVAFALIVGVSVLLRRQSWRAWILLLAYLGLDIAALLASGRQASSAR